MISRSGRLCGAAVLILTISTGGCAVGPVLSSNNTDAEIIAERDLLVDAAREVSDTPWPKPKPVSIVARIAGSSGEDRLSRGDAVDIYINTLQPAGSRFVQLTDHASGNLEAADRLSQVAMNAVSSTRVSMSDVATVENAIQSLRENRKIYTSAARALEKIGEPVNETQVDETRVAYSDAIRELGEAADALAERFEKDRTETIARPSTPVRHFNKLSGV